MQTACTEQNTRLPVREKSRHSAVCADFERRCHLGQLLQACRRTNQRQISGMLKFSAPTPSHLCCKKSSTSPEKAKGMKHDSKVHCDFHQSPVMACKRLPDSPVSAPCSVFLGGRLQLGIENMNFTFLGLKFTRIQRIPGRDPNFVFSKFTCLDRIFPPTRK